MRREEAKVKLRREVLAARESISPGERGRMSEEVFSQVLALPEYGAARTVLAYCGFGGEPETGMFLEAALRDGKRLVLPRVDRETKTLVLHEVSDPGSELVAGVWGIMEPDADLPGAGVEDVEFVLTPGVAFDRTGGRLGYGGGFYDRLLGGPPELPPLVAAAFEVQVVERVPVEAHDVRVDVVVTEGQIFFCEGNTGGLPDQDSNLD